MVGEMASDPWAFGWDQLIGLLQLAAVVVAAIVGYLSVRTWQAERLDRRQGEVAEQVLTLLYEAPDRFASIRSPAGFAGEGSTRPREPNEGPTDAEASTGTTSQLNASRKKLTTSIVWSACGRRQKPILVLDSQISWTLFSRLAGRSS